MRTADAYRFGSWAWLRSPRLKIDGDVVPIRAGPDTVIEQAMTDPRVAHFLVWSRYPYFHARPADGDWSVRIGDARYRGRGLGGLEVRVQQLRPAEAPAGTADPRARGRSP